MNIAGINTDRDGAALAFIWIAVAIISVVGVAIAPIAFFVLMISAFGLPHVLYELRYCDERFSERAPPVLLGVLGALVGTIALGRIANGTHWLSSDILVPIELGLGATLASVAAYWMRERRWLGALIGIAFALGASFKPIETFVVWAWLHNLTPLGFVAEVTQGPERRRWLMMLSVPFFVLPALVATGIFHDIAAVVLAMPELQNLSMFGAGDRPLLSFLPPGSYDLNLFSAAVVAQSMHYVAVIVLLPRLLKDKTSRTLVAWPGWGMFAAGVSAVALVAFGIYAVSYSDARAAYAVAAAIHAWIELPVLLLALGQGFRSARR
ncbi:MAG: hypothetical protein SGJ03_11135 [Alphaproteobacteria bacterium]|nr:hypothetical protein [Alphaproteobacteria bacterium]